jgi:hypothetical protein
MGPLFSLPLLLVEGDDDYQVWAHVARYGAARVAVLPSGGSALLGEREATLQRLFGALSDAPTAPLAYGLHDLDHRTLRPAATGTTVRRIWLGCREIENLYLTNQVLEAMGLDEASARGRLVAGADDVGSKHDAIIGVATGSWRWIDLKGVMGELIRLLDVKGVDWRIRLGQVIGGARPEGDLADWLGPDVMTAFW